MTEKTPNPDDFNPLKKTEKIIELGESFKKLNQDYALLLIEFKKVKTYAEAFEISIKLEEIKKQIFEIGNQINSVEKELEDLMKKLSRFN